MKTTTNEKTAISEQVEQSELFYEDTDMLLRIDSELESLKSRLNNFLSEYEKLAFKSLDEGNFKRILTIASNGNIAGALKTATDLIRQITGKDSDSRYLEKALTMVQNLHCKAVGVDTADTLSRVTIENGKITIHSDIEAYKAIFKAYATTPDQKTRLAKVRELCLMLESFKTAQIDPTLLNVRYITRYDRITGTFQPEQQYILNGY